MKKSKIEIALLLVIAAMIGFLVGGFLFQTIPGKETIKIVEKVEFTPANAYSVSLSVPAVDSEGKGVAVSFVIETRNGTGKVLTNIDKLLFWVDTQQSIQIAKSVAEEITKINASGMDLTYTIDTNATIIGGPSAGAALTLATIAALQNKKINESVSVTGTINPDGTIGKVGGVLEKAQAAKSVGIKLFLVPKGQGKESYLKPKEKCVERPGFVYCETTYSRVDVDISENAGIQVKEVENVEDAVKYFLI